MNVNHGLDCSTVLREKRASSKLELSIGSGSSIPQLHTPLRVRRRCQGGKGAPGNCTAKIVTPSCLSYAQDSRGEHVTSLRHDQTSPPTYASDVLATR